MGGRAVRRKPCCQRLFILGTRYIKPMRQLQEYIFFLRVVGASRQAEDKQRHEVPLDDPLMTSRYYPDAMPMLCRCYPDAISERTAVCHRQKTLFPRQFGVDAQQRLMG